MSGTVIQDKAAAFSAARRHSHLGKKNPQAPVSAREALGNIMKTPAPVRIGGEKRVQVLKKGQAKSLPAGIFRKTESSSREKAIAQLKQDGKAQNARAKLGNFRQKLAKPAPTAPKEKTNQEVLQTLFPKDEPSIAIKVRKVENGKVKNLGSVKPSDDFSAAHSASNGYLRNLGELVGNTESGKNAVRQPESFANLCTMETCYQPRSPTDAIKHSQNNRAQYPLFHNLEEASYARHYPAEALFARQYPNLAKNPNYQVRWSGDSYAAFVADDSQGRVDTHIGKKARIYHSDGRGGWRKVGNLTVETDAKTLRGNGIKPGENSESFQSVQMKFSRNASGKYKAEVKLELEGALCKTRGFFGGLRKAWKRNFKTK